MEQVPQNSFPVSDNAPEALAEYAALIGLNPAIEWQMETSEQLALLALAQNLRPEYAIEIGSRFGGSMQILSRYAKHLISCDIDTTCQERLGAKYPNVEFIAGNSQQTLPPLLARLQQQNAALSFILVDGDHSAAGVQGDIHAMLAYRPACTVYVLLHDSFNPPVRQGIRTARWSDNPYVHSVELDFVPGVMHYGGRAHRQMWGGFALAILRTEPRKGPLSINASKDELFYSIRRGSMHRPFDPARLTKRAAQKLVRMVGLK